MAITRTFHGVGEKTFPIDFKQDPAQDASFGKVDDHLLAATCTHFKQMLESPGELANGANKLPRTAYFPAGELIKALQQTNSTYVRLYHGIMNEELGKQLGIEADNATSAHFTFMAPVDEQGMAIAGAPVLLPACIGPNPPCSQTNDIFFTE
jgi:hypothetical protein